MKKLLCLMVAFIYLGYALPALADTKATPEAQVSSDESFLDSSKQVLQTTVSATGHGIINIVKFLGNGIYNVIKAIGDGTYNIMAATANKLDDIQIAMAESLGNMADGSANCVSKLTANNDC
ncbi:hypothetical protein EDC55_101133 [Allofrancisella inopinata]|uniref:Uncharacterized protein n=1 Tax=Allofrancisella inopinata TaxID=1085647 RepID=A0AAE6YI00_9GAMM|nr:hypothetical protein [Allofrancisella inopinata]QIV96310.1 hypothetical protein E4K63_05490 [Allofrancisella inopinata]TDT74587.1 hypothetical protein EDC55_101133 [Allofrancisella inopinata]